MADSISSISNNFEVIYNAVAQPDNPLQVTVAPTEENGRLETIELPPHITSRVFEYIHFYTRSEASIDRRFDAYGKLQRQSLYCSMTEPRAGAPPIEELTVLQGGVLFKKPTPLSLKRRQQHAKTTSDGLVSCSERYSENFAKKMEFLAEICLRGC